MNRSVPLKVIAVVVGALVVLGGTFYGGMAYEDHRIASAVKTAFSGFGDPSDSSSAGSSDDTMSADSEDKAPEPVEIAEGQSLDVKTGDSDKMRVTLLSTEVNEASGTYDGKNFVRNLHYNLKIENTGDASARPELSAHYETDAGQVLDFSGVFCEDDDLPTDDIDPGQFVQGCESADLPAEAGRLVFDEDNASFYIKVDAAG